MDVAVIGGGINGVMTAWELQKLGHNISLFEKNNLMVNTSSASSKLLHGGLRYLENYEFRLVKEALRERHWWISNAPQHTKPLKIFIPIYKKSRRPAFIYKVGLWLYDFLAGVENIGTHESYTKRQIQQSCPELKTEQLMKGFSYYDGVMDDYKLGLWAAEQAKKIGMKVYEQTLIDKIDLNGNVYLENRGKKSFDRIINVAGPWSQHLLEKSDVPLEYTLDLVRGSHIVVERPLEHGYFLEIPNERRIFFVLPYNNKTLIGTTEKRQQLSEKIEVSDEEIDYLIIAYNQYFKNSLNRNDIITTFSGVRPLIKSSHNPNKATREYAIQTNNKITSVFGGKWTTSRKLAKNVVKSVLR